MPIFDYYESVKPMSLLIGDEYVYSSSIFYNPDEDVLFYGIFNPGHAGTVKALEYAFRFDVTEFSTTTGGPLVLKLQYKESGAATWADLVVHNNYPDAGTERWDAKGHYFTEIELPFEIRLIATDADANWRLVEFSGDVGGYGEASNYGHLYLRAVGTVS